MTLILLFIAAFILCSGSFALGRLTKTEDNEELCAALEHARLEASVARRGLNQIASDRAGNPQAEAQATLDLIDRPTQKELY